MSDQATVAQNFAKLAPSAPPAPPAPPPATAPSLWVPWHRPYRRGHRRWQQVAVPLHRHRHRHGHGPGTSAADAYAALFTHIRETSAVGRDRL
jgi:hypothetical protein